MREQVSLVRDDVSRGVEGLRPYLETMRSVRFACVTLGALASLAQGLAKLGRREEALTVLDSALELDEWCGTTFRTPELMRLKAEVLMSFPRPRLNLADVVLGNGLQAARDQGAIAWESRIALSITRMRLLSGHQAEEQAVGHLRAHLNRSGSGHHVQDFEMANMIEQPLYDFYLADPFSAIHAK